MKEHVDHTEEEILVWEAGAESTFKFGIQLQLKEENPVNLLQDYSDVCDKPGIISKMEHRIHTT